MFRDSGKNISVHVVYGNPLVDHFHWQIWWFTVGNSFFRYQKYRVTCLKVFFPKKICSLIISNKLHQSWTLEQIYKRQVFCLFFFFAHLCSAIFSNIIIRINNCRLSDGDYGWYPLSLTISYTESEKRINAEPNVLYWHGKPSRKHFSCCLQFMKCQLSMNKLSVKTKKYKGFTLSWCSQSIPVLEFLELRFWFV